MGYEQLKAYHALPGAVAEPDEIAALISWQASDDPSDINGPVVTTDNGWTAA